MEKATRQRKGQELGSRTRCPAPQTVRPCPRRDIEQLSFIFCETGLSQFLQVTAPPASSVHNTGKKDTVPSHCLSCALSLVATEPQQSAVQKEGEQVKDLTYR